MSSAGPTPYDRVPYPSAPYPQSHPGRLAAVGSIFGMRPPPLAGARVLELGCADGSNLIPMAMDLSAASFLGLDLSRRQVAAGLELVRRLGLSNIRLECRDIRDLDREPGPFDYIIAHGVFSWVPQDVQESILGACGRLLSEHGIAYISYNTYPGWHLRELLRRMMLYHTEQVADPGHQVGQARALVRFLAEAVPAEGDPYGMLLHKELRQMDAWDDAYLRHDVLEEVNEPLYFHEFARRAEVHGLRYLGEAEFHTMVGDNLPSHVAGTLRRITADLVQTEQYMDFVRNRMFRQTLLCRREVALERRVTATRLAGLWVSAPLREESPAGGERPTPERLPVVFTHPGCGTIQAGTPIARDALRRIAAAWPGAVRVLSLLEAPGGVAETGTGGAGGGGLAETLLACVSRGLLEVSAHAPACAANPGERPLASPLARAQAAKSLLVTTLRHDAAQLEPVHAHLLPLMDGTRTAAALVEELIPAAMNGPLSVREAGEMVRDPRRLRPLLRDVVQRSIEQLARVGLLSGMEGRGNGADQQ